MWTATDVNANFPDLWPFKSDHPKEFKRLPPDTKIDAALVFNDPQYNVLRIKLTKEFGDEIPKLSLTWFFRPIGHLGTKID